ncbi:LytTR family DNA-binding domain-containing protein [Rhizobium sp. NRK18]|uniref:LytTR family DNA-binding domain-containing protein n=1 Tax=Rhizobium sp. NRK18 TaxID=2964667 RepID=UPI0021C34A19|nr:LytTR family transcriptional regulator DNA-binding domain-containing protein [Rhizobium sp. NRK18]MCQ2002414.1 LytTR family transcriptional regulator DNA-binding domain-containing protein [Rhizobium sp. NRK18]
MREGYVDGSSLHLALREMQAEFSSWRTWVALAVVIALLIVSGPFQTMTTLSLPQRSLYWCALVVTTFVAGNFAGTWCNYAIRAREWRQPWRFMTVGVSAGVPAAIAVTAINGTAFGWQMLALAEIVELAAYSIFISVLVAGLFALYSRSAAEAPVAVDAGAEDDLPAILRRLPFPKRGRLVSISVSDHYVEVTTLKGREMLLMRLRDAVAECPPEKGLQIHRSHWVALAGVKGVYRSGGKVMVETVAGDHFPVSRSYLADARAAGLNA